MDSFPAAKGEQENQEEECNQRPLSFGYAGTKSPLTTNQRTSSGWVLAGINNKKKNKQMETATNYGSWPRQRPRRRGDRSKRERLDDVFLPGQL